MGPRHRQRRNQARSAIREAAMIGLTGVRRQPSRRKAIHLGLALAALLLGSLPVPAVRSWQDEADGEGGPVAGLGMPGEIVFAFIGRIERRESSVTVYGYLTAVAGLTAEEVFADPADPSAAAARFTIFGDAEPEPRLALDELEVVAAAGELSVYYNPRAGASF